jgi:hypothetical protein
MTCRIRLVSCLLMLSSLLFVPDKAATAAPLGKPKVLLFTTIDDEHLADTVTYWGNSVGVNGFILSYVAQWWSTKDEIFRNLALLKEINEKGRKYDIDSNFIKVALGSRELPLWTDDQAWKSVIENFRNIATLVKQTRTRGIAIDTERYNVSSLYNPNDKRFKAVNQVILRKKVYERGRQIMLAMTEAYPDIEVILLPEGHFYYSERNDKEYALWIDFYKGLESVKNNQGITLALEGTYSITDTVQLSDRYNRTQAAMRDAVNDQKLWQEKCTLAIGMWPIGKAYDNKSARYSPADFQKQFSQAVALSPKYVWIYDHGTSWFQLSKADADKYTNGGKWIWKKEYQILPTDPNIDEYYSVLRNYKQGGR